MEGLRCSVAVISLGEGTKVIEPVGLQEIQVAVNGAEIVAVLEMRLMWTCTQIQITLLPTSIEELSIPPALLFTKDQRKR